MNINKIPKGIRRIVPYPLKRFGVRLYVRYMMRGCPGTPDKPRISFAEILPPEGSFIRGGKVKLTHLRKKFGEYKRGFNILYLVSSTLPGFADIWVDEAKRKGVKVVWNQNGVGCPAWTPIWEKVNRSMTPIKDADYIAYQSAFAKEGADLWVTKSPSPWTIITNCCDINEFKPATPPIPASPLRLHIMGTHMTPEKVMIPLKALHLLVQKGLDVHLNIFGPCEWPGAEAELAKSIKEFNLEGRIKRHGKFLQPEAPDLYRQGHIFLHLKHMDSSPTAILEAMSSGLPVVGSKSGGLVEWIPETAGILLEVPISWEKLYYPEPQAVADAVEKISLDWPAWSAGARANALAHFGVDDWVSAHATLFNHVLGIK
jgi:glycosyltransferase involved in cell wall biosynthesis